MPHTSETMVVKWRPMHRAWTLIPSIVVYPITGLIGALIVGFCWTLPWATPWDPWIAAILWLSMVAFVQWLLKGWEQGAIAIDLKFVNAANSGACRQKPCVSDAAVAVRGVAGSMRSTPSPTDLITPESHHPPSGE